MVEQRADNSGVAEEQRTWMGVTPQKSGDTLCTQVLGLSEGRNEEQVGIFSKVFIQRGL